MATPTSGKLERATLGGGCFWCTEAVFRAVRGVVDVIPGYAGGATENPSYEDVCTGETGHAEVIQVTFDPAVLPYRDVLEIFFATHDPTTMNRQGGDVGTQYRSVILYASPSQLATAQEVIAEMKGEQKWGHRVVTELVPLAKFYPAEEYHHDYFRKNPDRGYCQAVISPKMTKFRAKFAERLKPAM
ncbi:MAG: peptide-methionine (S)-S-oxide reductase MsrA [Thermoplasmata archaeon]|nr:peptide-methionine (S)-S-oxide reductase MsrA [Thermoplasmata archaeon]